MANGSDPVFAVPDVRPHARRKNGPRARSAVPVGAARVSAESVWTSARTAVGRGRQGWAGAAAAAARARVPEAAVGGGYAAQTAIRPARVPGASPGRRPRL